MDTLFPIENIIIPEPVLPNEFPYFIIAYWQRGGYWKLHRGLYKTAENRELQEYINTIQQAGWTNVHIMRLPALP